MTITLEIIGLLALLTFMFVSIWGFIIVKQLLSQTKYKNYLMEKLIESISLNLKEKVEYEEEKKDI